MMKEKWNDIYFIENNIIYDYRGLYQVSNLGNIKSLNYNHTKKEQILKQCKNYKGYLQVGLYKNNKVKQFKVHKLVAHMFCDGYFDGAEVDHINTIKNDNRAENLCWCTSKQNSNNELTKNHYSEAKNGKKHPSSKKIAQYDMNNNLIKIWDYGKLASKELNICYTSIIKCCNGKHKSAGGFIWRYYGLELLGNE